MRRKTFFGVLVSLGVVGGVVFGLGASGVMNSNAAKLIQTSGATSSDKATIQSTVDSDYQEVQDEENYIVSLVSKKTNKNLKTSDWKECLKYLEANYDTLLKDKSVDTDKVKSYVEAYKLVSGTATAGTEEETDQVATRGTTADVATGTNGTYDVSKVLAYIEEYNDKYNEAYPCYNGRGGDCANFVSQCLAAGGMQMKGTNASNFNNWFCRTNNYEEYSKVSSTWRGAEAFGSYWKKNALDYKEFPREQFADKLAFREVFKYANVGDAISFMNSNGRPYHTTIVSFKNRDNDRLIRFAAHTSFQYDKSLYEYVLDHPAVATVRVYRMSEPDPEMEASYDYNLENVQVEVIDSLNP